ncbi:hypothetical protein FF38_12292 [Lucilia cuprina]|uniref:Uncharacterized protein n=1 Tax=Lucilia cuprina TaxID=7375 RepID=A0A0L0CRJ6_LUCCU|nr:hypothetical protein FF38_12292 [Lucilia cuprina]
MIHDEPDHRAPQNHNINKLVLKHHSIFVCGSPITGVKAAFALKLNFIETVCFVVFSSSNGGTYLMRDLGSISVLSRELKLHSAKFLRFLPALGLGVSFLTSAKRGVVIGVKLSILFSLPSSFLRGVAAVESLSESSILSFRFERFLADDVATSSSDESVLNDLFKVLTTEDVGDDSVLLGQSDPELLVLRLLSAPLTLVLDCGRFEPPALSSSSSAGDVSSVISVSSWRLLERSQRFLNGFRPPLVLLRVVAGNSSSCRIRLFNCSSSNVGAMALPVVSQFFIVPPLVFATLSFASTCLLVVGIFLKLVSLFSSNPKNSLPSSQSFRQASS